MIRCLHCGAETSNGLALCELCQRGARLIFEYLPIYFRNLARWRPGRTGSRQVPGSRVLYDGPLRIDGTGDKISDRLDEAMSAMTTWARLLVNDRPHHPRPLTYVDAVLTGDIPDDLADALTDDQPAVVAALCVAFERHLTSISTLDWCGDFVRDIAHHEVVLRGLTEEMIPGWYAGACGHCGSATYVVPGLTWVTCNGIIGWTNDEPPRPIRCGATTYARDHLDTILDEARGWVARPMRLAEALVALVDTEMSVPRLHKRIAKWGEREQITALRQTTREHAYSEAEDRVVVAVVEVGHPRYRFGDVVDLLLNEGATRTGPRVPIVVKVS
jgi:hypothetical protein